MIATVRCATWNRQHPNRDAGAPNGDESRQKILAAATAIAGERGYDGTSIALVSERSGLPASSIYWHFKDKDALLAAVIERSWVQWVAGMSTPVQIESGASRLEIMRALMRRTGRALLESPDFLRLGLMLTLERRPGRARRPHRVPAHAG